MISIRPTVNVPTWVKHFPITGHIWILHKKRWNRKTWNFFYNSQIGKFKTKFIKPTDKEISKPYSSVLSSDFTESKMISDLLTSRSDLIPFRDLVLTCRFPGNTSSTLLKYLRKIGDYKFGNWLTLTPKTPCPTEYQTKVYLDITVRCRHLVFPFITGNTEKLDSQHKLCSS